MGETERAGSRRKRRARESGVCARAHNLGRGADHAHRHVWDKEHGRVAGRSLLGRAQPRYGSGAAYKTKGDNDTGGSVAGGDNSVRSEEDHAWRTDGDAVPVHERGGGNDVGPESRGATVASWRIVEGAWEKWPRGVVCGLQRFVVVPWPEGVLA